MLRTKPNYKLAKTLRGFRTQYRKKRMHEGGIRYKQLKRRIPLPLGGFPRRLMVKLKYCQTFSLNPSAGGIAVQEFRANSLYDPDFTGTGHQPSNYDRLALLYDNYTVVKSYIKVTPVSISTVTSQQSLNPGVLAIHLSEAGGDLAIAHAQGGIDNVMEQPRIARSLKPLLTGITSAPYVWKRSFNAKSFFGVKEVIGVEPYVSGIGGNPTEGAHFEVGLMSPNDTLDSGAHTFRAEITYYAMMTEPKIADAS